MTNWNKTKEFAKLKSKWYKKLTKSGFVDEEHSETKLKKFSGVTSIDRIDGTSKLEDWAEWGHSSLSIADHWKSTYYSRCRQFLEEYKFKNKKEKAIFEMHSEGIGIRAIADKLKTYRRKVHETIQRLVKEMKGE